MIKSRSSCRNGKRKSEPLGSRVSESLLFSLTRLCVYPQALELFVTVRPPRAVGGFHGEEWVSVLKSNRDQFLPEGSPQRKLRGVFVYIFYENKSGVTVTLISLGHFLILLTLCAGALVISFSLKPLQVMPGTDM